MLLSILKNNFLKSQILKQGHIKVLTGNNTYLKKDNFTDSVV